MARRLAILYIVFLFNSVNLFSQTPADVKPKNYLGFQFGSGFFQDIQLQLTDLDRQLVATSDPLVPSQLKANYTYFFTRNIGLRFSSGYIFARQLNRENVNFGRIDSLDLRYEDKARFKLSGFPVELAFVFQVPIDTRENFFFNVGIGAGYYTYNYESNGSIKEFRVSNGKVLKDEKYDIPYTTLTGWAQFISVGTTLRISRNMGASFELSKVGFSNLYFEKDVVKRQIYEREIEHQFIYGSEKDDYTTKKGFDDISMVVGIFWYL